MTAVTLVDQFTHSLMNVPEVTCECVFTMENNGDFSQRVIDMLFRLAMTDSTWIFLFCVELRIYIQSTVKVPSFLNSSSNLVWLRETGCQ